MEIELAKEGCEILSVRSLDFSHRPNGQGPPLVQHAPTASDRQPDESATLGRLPEYASRLLQVSRIEKPVQRSTVVRPTLDLVGLIR
jgi:hypothetical protein